MRKTIFTAILAGLLAATSIQASFAQGGGGGGGAGGTDPHSGTTHSHMKHRR